MRSFEKILVRYGAPVTIFPDGTGEGITAMALIQPIRDKDRQNVPSPLGWRKDERWLYLGEPDIPLEVGEGGFVRAGAREFEVYSARRVDLGRETCHWWGILVPREEAV